MTNDYDSDALLLSLARLPVVMSSPGRDARTRRRCHRALDRRTAAARRRSRSSVARIADVALAAVACGYAIVALLQAFRLIH